MPILWRKGGDYGRGSRRSAGSGQIHLGDELRGHSIYRRPASAARERVEPSSGPDASWVTLRRPEIASDQAL